MVHVKRSEKPVIVVQLSAEMDAFWRAIIDVAREQEWRIHDINLDKGILAPGLRPRGALLSTFADSPLVEQLKKMGCACVRNAGFPHPLDDQMPAIMPDSEAIGRMAARHFSSRGFKHVGYLVNEPRDTYDRKLDGMVEETDRLGMEFHALRKPRFGTVETVLGDQLIELPNPIGLFGVSSHVLKMIRGITGIGWKVPEDVAILSPVDSLRCEASIIPLSAVELDLAAQGRQAALTLKRMLAGEEFPSRVQVPPKGVVLRQSTDVLAVQDPSVARALLYIWEYYHWPLTVDDVAREVDISRSTLHRRFRQFLGRSVNEEIRRKRLEECAKLLRNSSRSLADIARLVGLQNRGYLHKVFTKAFGMTPGHYRKA